MNKIEYRPDIDGLRSVAVLSVIFFHSNFSNFSHGFIGVDIFFVISGYLITKILHNNDYQLLTFYDRRIRRIIPNYFFILLITSFFIYKFNPDIGSLKEFTKSFLNSLGFISNFFFMSNDYFEQNISRPFLHTWSLSVEEQFYVFYPFLLLGLKKFKYSFKITIIIFLILLNLSLINFGGNLKLNYPYVEKEFLFFSDSIFFNFYSPLSRFWEFLFGALAYFTTFKISKIVYKNIILIISYFLIIFSIMYQGEFLFYPNLFTIVPVLSTFFIITFEGKDSISYKVITNKIFVIIGLRSFSLYLWHLPVFEIYKYVGLNIANISIYLSYIIVIFILSEFTFRFIETPFRNRSKTNFYKLWLFILSILFISVALIYINNNKNYKNEIKLNNLNFTFVESLNKNILFKDKIILNHDENLDKIKLEYDQNNKKKILIIGDSVSEDLAIAIKGTNKFNDYQVRHLTYGLKKLIINTKKNIKIFDSSLYKQADIVIFNFKAFTINLSANQLNNRISYSNKIKKYVEQDKKIVFFSSNNPNFNTLLNPLVYLIKVKKINDEKQISRELYKLIPEKFHNYNSKLIKYYEKNNINHINLFSIFCDNISKKCKFMDANQNILFFDFVHLTKSGKDFLGNRLDIVF